MERPAHPPVWEEVPESHFLEIVYLFCLFAAIIIGAVIGLMTGLGIHIPAIFVILAVWIPSAFQGLAAEPGSRLNSMGTTFAVACVALLVLWLIALVIGAIL